ncbi:MAG: transcription initiation factor IIB [Methanophagales archaeon ANME-1-THS]|nr:MAG: transcription initiation factor IIB [Methanophagales archaeon ANME-1-THS]
MNKNIYIIMPERIRKCPECGSKNIITDHKHAELYCADCGVVIAEKLVDLGPEWRAYDEEQASKRIRTGPPMSYRIHNKGLGTPTPKSLESTKRLRGIISDSGEKTLAVGLGEIDRMASALNLPNDIKEAASLLYRKSAKQNLIKGRSIEELGSAVLYITCRQYGVPRTLKEIAKVSRMPLKKIRRAYLFLLKNLGIKLAPPDPARYIPRFSSELGLSNATRERAIALMRESKGIAVAKGWGPTGMAAGAIYLAATLGSESVAEKDVARIAGITPITLRNRYKELEKRFKLNINALSSLPDNGDCSVEAIT